MCRALLLQEIRLVRTELDDLLRKFSWFIGIMMIPHPNKPFEFIVCSKEGKGAQTLCDLKEILAGDFAEDGYKVGIFKQCVIKVFPEGGDLAKMAYEMWEKRKMDCAGKGLPRT